MSLVRQCLPFSYLIVSCPILRTSLQANPKCLGHRAEALRDKGNTQSQPELNAGKLGRHWYEFPRSATTDYHTVGGITLTTSVILKLRRSQLQNQGVRSYSQDTGKNPFMPLLASDPLDGSWIILSSHPIAFLPWVPVS